MKEPRFRTSLAAALISALGLLTTAPEPAAAEPAPAEVPLIDLDATEPVTNAPVLAALLRSRPLHKCLEEVSEPLPVRPIFWRIKLRWDHFGRSYRGSWANKVPDQVSTCLKQTLRAWTSPLPTGGWERADVVLFRGEDDPEARAAAITAARATLLSKMNQEEDGSAPPIIGYLVDELSSGDSPGASVSLGDEHVPAYDALDPLNRVDERVGAAGVTLLSRRAELERCYHEHSGVIRTFRDAVVPIRTLLVWSTDGEVHRVDATPTAINAGALARCVEEALTGARVLLDGPGAMLIDLILFDGTHEPRRRHALLQTGRWSLGRQLQRSLNELARSEAHFGELIPAPEGRPGPVILAGRRPPSPNRSGDGLQLSLRCVEGPLLDEEVEPASRPAASSVTPCCSRRGMLQINLTATSGGRVEVGEGRLRFNVSEEAAQCISDALETIEVPSRPEPTEMRATVRCPEPTP